ncbi:DUF3488 and transglutaminase-like domain-containing protein [Pleionea sp. CnH1-48]|uniref:transglutaminase TgpA family protein n=1 Tax=Pleionea sp. CnH1-48 TaxID=2954494 RepID=UPI00209680FB|nr:DUF3488 and transglutaminase-like domain-containing protein [Pleionea sp. CnH1-48]MCO7222960.1 DUF3488 and transglutaminase-like domain-containing protein [Pleionea sp. CnH1-48]
MLILPESQRQVQSLLRIRLAIVQICVLLPIIFSLPLQFGVIIAFAPLWTIVRIHLKQSPMLGRWLLVAITVISAAAVWFHFGTFRGRDAGVSLVAVMYSLKILECRHYRDVNLLLTLAFFMLAMNFLFTQEIWAVFYLLAALLLITHTLMYANANDVSKVEVKKGAKILLYSIPVMMFFFVFFPRLSGPLWHIPSSQSAGTGVSDSMTPGDIGALHLIDEVAFRVKFLDASPEPGDLYWRALVFENYDGLSWTQDRRRNDIPLARQEAEGDVLRYEITLEATKQRWLYGLDLPVSTPPGTRLKSDGTFSAARRVEKRIRYRGSSVTRMPLEVELPPLSRTINTELPSSGNDEAKQWARETYAQFNDTTNYVNYLLRFIYEQPFFYTLTPPILKEDMVDNFWFGTRRGFCEHYASSFVYMLRAVGIPARVVVGYHGGDYNALGDYWIITQAEAHAWAEYWMEGKGWVRVDPTAAIAPHRVEQQLLNQVGLRNFLFDDLPVADFMAESGLNIAQLWLDNVNRAWQDWVIDFNQSKQFDLFNQLKPDSWGLGRLFGISVVGILLFLAVIAWRMSRSRESLDHVARSYLILTRRLAKKGFEKHHYEGPQDFVHRVIREKPQWSGELNPILRLYLKLKFSNDSAQFAKKHKQLRTMVKRVRLVT